MKSPSVSIEKLTITIGSRKLELTLEEARQLKKALNDALEPQVNIAPSVIIHREAHRNPWPIWESPGPWATTPEPPFHQVPQITCGSPFREGLTMAARTFSDQ